WMIYRHTRVDQCPSQKPPVGVNTQFDKELCDVLRLQRNFCFRISSQGAGFDELALSCFRVLHRTLSHDEIPHLRVEIHPPHPDRPVDMVYIWRGVQKLCQDLRAASIIRSLEISFMEDGTALWSTNSIAHESMGVMPWAKNPANCDVSSILDNFARLTNVTRAEIHLPNSLEEDPSDLQWFAQAIEDSITGVDPFNQEAVKTSYELLVEDIDRNEPDIKAATGRKSAAKLEAFYGESPRLTCVTLQKFQDLWPHLDDIGLEGAEKYLDWD
ncbi:MAG: hypothetical protein Q9217_007102, partial [Psora testacea]